MWPFHPLVGGHLTIWKGHLTIPKRPQRIAIDFHPGYGSSCYCYGLLLFDEVPSKLAAAFHGRWRFLRGRAFWKGTPWGFHMAQRYESPWRWKTWDVRDSKLVWIDTRKRVPWVNIYSHTLSPIIMEVENILYLKGNYYWRDPFLTSMIMGGSVYVFVFWDAFVGHEMTSVGHHGDFEEWGPFQRKVLVEETGFYILLWPSFLIVSNVFFFQ